MIGKTCLASLAIILFLTGCSSAPAASPTAAPAQQAAQAAPTAAPTAVPTKAPTVAPTKAPTAAPTAAPQAASAPSFKEFSFESTTTAAGQTVQANMAFKNGKMRIDATIMGQQTSMIIDQAAKTAIMWTAGQNQAMKMPMDQAQQQTGAVPDVQNLTSDSNRKLVGTETVDGQLCDVYESTDGDIKSKTWISKSNGFPVKSEVTTPAGVVTSVYKNFKTGGVADNLFELPAGMQVMDLGELMKGGVPRGQMPNIPGGQMPNIPGGQMPNIPGVPTK